jgi:hypothetical protein
LFQNKLILVTKIIKIVADVWNLKKFQTNENDDRQYRGFFARATHRIGVLTHAREQKYLKEGELE